MSKSKKANKNVGARSHKKKKSIRRKTRRNNVKGGSRERKQTDKGRSYQTTKTIQKAKHESRAIHKRNIDDLTSMFEGLTTNRITRRPYTSSKESLDDVFKTMKLSK